MLTLVSLVSVIPLSYYLRQEYLSRKEEEKDILVLEKEGKYGSMAEKALSNKVTNIAMRLREKIVDIKQMAYLLNRKIKSEEENKRIGRIVSISDETLDLVNDFEETSTGKRVIGKSR